MIGICTPFKIDNYGTKLQAYAVQEKIKELNYDFEIINFDRRSDHRINKLFYRYCNKNFIIGKLKRKKSNKSEDILLKQNKKIRKDAINSFDGTHYKLTPKIKGYRNLKEYSKRFDALICGSDQIWLPTSVNNPTTTLEFGGKNCKRISFAPSFGISEIPKNKEKYYKKFLEKFDSLSVREVTGAQIIKKVAKREAKVILDPTLTVKKTVWDGLCNDSRKTINDKYIFCYFLGANEEHRKAVYNLAKKENLKIVTLPHFKSYNECDEKYTDIRLYDVTPNDFVGLIKNAEYVCTDSFHATVFAIIYHKYFYTFERFKKDDKKSANSRIYSLLSLLELKDRIPSEEKKYELDKNEIDFNKVDYILNDLRNQTDEYLLGALESVSKKEKKDVTFCPLNKDKCCGCGACVAICPNNCLEMAIEEETGFSYPKLKQGSNCFNCNLCNSVCPNKKERNFVHSIENPYYIKNKDEDIRTESASGGIFYPIAEKIIEDGGFVCAAKYNDKYNVVHEIVNTKKELIEMISSKYSESNLGTCFIEIKKLLDNNQKVLFVGTPCQAHGLSSYLQKEYDNLLIIDLLCYGIQSPKAWNRYKEYIESNGRKIKNINMRNKSISWQDYSMKIEFDDGKEYLVDKTKDPYLKSYSKGLFIRPSCYKCNLKAFPRKSDITIGDFWDIDKIMPEENDGKGASILLYNTEKGKEIIKSIRNKFVIKEINEDTLKKVHTLFGISAKKSRKSNKFFKLLKTDMSFDKIVKKCEQTKLEKKIRKVYSKIKRG